MIPVMIVEDEFLVRIGLRSMIDWESYGFTVVADADSGERALELYRMYHPFLILTDICMSPIDGLELMRLIRDEDKAVHFVVISAYSRFEYAQQAIRYGVDLYLKKSDFTEEDLAPALREIAAQYQREGHSQETSCAIEELADVLPVAGETAELEAWFERQNLLNTEKRALALRIDRTAEQPMPMNVLIAMMRDMFENTALTVRLFTRELFLIVLAGGNGIDGMERIAQRLIETTDQYFSPQLYAGISARFSDPAYAHQAINDACKTCSNFLLDKSCRVRVYRRESLNNDFKRRLNQSCDALQQSLYACDFEAYTDLIAKTIGGAENYSMLEHTVFSVIMVLEHFDSSILCSSLFRDVMSDDISEITASLTEIGRNICDRKHESAVRDPIDDILDYIRKHLQEDISLVRLAGMYFFSPNYLGQLFRQKTGVYYNTFVADLRINTACELLLDSETSVSEIGKMVGIEDPHYFSKLFKDKIGLTPNQYRKRWRE